MLRELETYRRLPVDFVSAEGCELVLADGKRVLDLYGGHCVNTLGAGDTALGDELSAQWQSLSFATNLIDHAPRAEFLAAFGALTPAARDWRVFCGNSGAEANENALKAALAATGRDTVIAFEGAFHGRTSAAAAVSDRKSGFPAAPFNVVRVPFGNTELAQQAIDGSVGAVILEPIQSLAGVIDPPDGFLEALRAACDASGAALIFDEVQTASGRLGVATAAEHFGVLPDIYTTAKGAGGGLPIGLTVIEESWAQRLPGGLFGSTFGGGPYVLAAAAEVARRVAEPAFLENVVATSDALIAGALCGPVKGIRGAGLLLGLELEDGYKAGDVRDALLAKGVLVGTCDDPSVLRLSPPLVLTPDDAKRLAIAFDSLVVTA
jgi:acetylornithine/N-succinyldiaminopimelate aminotransferase